MARGRYLQIRLSDDEYKRLQNNANKVGVSKSELVRQFATKDYTVNSNLFEFCDAQTIAIDRDSVEALRKQIRAWGYHYDQAIHALNIIAAKGFMRQEETYETITKAISLLGDINDAKEALFESTNRIEVLALKANISFPTVDKREVVQHDDAQND